MLHGRISSLFIYCSANFPENVVDSLPSEVKSGVYFGWASVDNGPVYKMVMSVGWNPQFQNEKRSMVSSFVYCQAHSVTHYYMCL